MIVGTLLKVLDIAPESELVVIDLLTGDRRGIDDVGSNQGYYAQVALQPTTRPGFTAGAIAAFLRDLKANGMDGYRGGHDDVDDDTPVWVSERGVSSGLAVVGHRLGRGKTCLLTASIGEY